MAILNVPIQVRVDNEQNWDNSTLILKDGEPALCKKEDGTQELKFGDGQKTYKELSPFGGNQVEENSGDLLVTLTSIENNQASATYEQIKATINNKHLVAVIYEEEVYMLDKVQSNGTIEFRLDNSQGQKYLGISSSGVWYENSSSWQAVNINIDEVEGLEATNVQDALAELKEDGVQLNDSAVNTTEAWSSKKIVDTLCSPFSVSGNPVTCHPVEGYPLSAAVTLKPKQEGTGDPSPENVRPISGYNSVTVTQSKDEAQVKQITLTLPETVYGGTVDAVTGEGSEEWIVKMVVTSTYGVYILPDFENEASNLFYLGNVTNQEKADMLLCSHLLTKNIVPATLTDTGIYGNPEGDIVYIRLAKDIANDLQGFKSWLDAQASAGTPVQLAYKLATPEPFQATGNQALPAVAGLNTVYTDGDSLAVSGRSDPTAYIQQQISDAITAAVAITGGT